MSHQVGFVRQTRQLKALFKALVYSTLATTIVLFALGLLLAHVHVQMLRQSPAGPQIPFPAPASVSDGDSIYLSGSNNDGDEDSDGGDDRSDYYSGSDSGSHSIASDDTVRPFGLNKLKTQSNASTIRARPRKFAYDVSRYADSCAIDSDSSDSDDGYESDLEVENKSKPMAKRPRSSCLTAKNLADLQAALA